MQNIADGLTQSVASDGQTPMSGALNMATNKINNLGTPVVSTDAATKAYVDLTQTASGITGGTITGATLTNDTIDSTPIGSTTRSTVKATTLDLGLSTQSVAIGQGNASIMKNRIINGAMVIDQRNAGASVTVNSTSATFCADRWKGVGQASDGVYTLQQVADAPTGFNYSLKATVTTADASVTASQFYNVFQAVEGYNIADLGWGGINAKIVTFSFWVKSSLTGTMGGSLYDNGADYCYPFTYTISSANTWEQKTITITGATSGTWLTTNGTGVNVNFSIGDGTSRQGTAGSWTTSVATGATGQTQLISTLNATIQWTGVQLEVGSSATGFEYRQYGQELALCQRYYATCFWNVVTPILGYSTITTPVSMRTAPTIAGGGTGFAAVVSGAYSTIASQTSAGAQTLTFTAEL
jgi:hypothetical protein